MEDEKKQELRRHIKATQQDASLNAQQKAFRIQLLMRGKTLEQIQQEEQRRSEEVKKEKERESQKWDPPTEKDLEPSYQNAQEGILGCKHYRLGCKVRAACCGKFFPCRLCHDEQITDHKIDRYATQEMICLHCKRLQPIAQTCSNPECGKTLAKYYCDVCKFHDDTPNKSIYHCPHCGLCRIGQGLGIDFFHCMTCNMCLAVALQGNHKCIENNMKADCPICGSDLFTSTSASVLMKCGHSIHSKCLNKYHRQGHYTCPLCSKSVLDMTDYWSAIDQDIQQQPMPTEFAAAKCHVLCNDCEKKTESTYHFLGQKCQECGSYNTSLIQRTGEWPAFPVQLTIPNSTNNNNAVPSDNVTQHPIALDDDSSDDEELIEDDESDSEDDVIEDDDDESDDEEQ